MTQQTVIRQEDLNPSAGSELALNAVKWQALGGMAYPFLPAALAWDLISRPLDDAEQIQSIDNTPEPTLRWVKDDKVMDLHIPGMDTAAFLERSGLTLSMERGGYVLSKRLSRVMRPYRYWGFFEAGEVLIEYNDQLISQLWDGCGQVSRGFVQRLADSLELDERHRRELLNANRFEVTTLHAGGQDKGHVMVIDDLAVDFMFPTGSAKTGLSLCDGRTFIGLQPVHSDDQMCLDIQSLINLHPFFQPEHLLAWAGMES
jgi:hypothetical protein